MSEVRQRNMTSILRLLNRDAMLSRKDIATELGLTPAAVTNLCADLIEKGLVRETGEEEQQQKAGRKKVLLSLCLNDFYAISVNMETDETVISAVRLDGLLCCSKKISNRNDPTAEKQIQFISDEIEKLIADSNIPKGKFIGIGIGIVGAYDTERDITTGNYGIWNPNINIPSLFSKYTSLPVVCNNNVKAFACAELLYGNYRDRNNLFFVKWSSGVGSAMIINSHICHDGPLGSQEIGHYIIDGCKNKCRCGRTGCLETLVSSRALAPLFNEKPEHNLAIQSRIMNFATAVVNTATVISPEKVIVFGKMWNENTLNEFIKDCTQLFKGFDSNYIELSSLQKQSDYIGPAALVTESLFFKMRLVTG